MEPLYKPNERSYAMDLVKYAPKHKFMFVVEFEFNESQNSQFNKVFTSLVRSCDRPSFKVDTEPVNLYGYLTEVVKTSTWQPIKMSFTDDVQNHSMRTLVRFINKMNPISNIAGSPELYEIMQLTDAQPKLQNKKDGDGTYKAMAYAGMSGPPQTSYAAGAAGENDVGILRSIRIWHVFRFGEKINKYTLYNPRITEMNLDALSMEEADGCKIDFTISYDAATFDLDLSPSDVNLPELVPGMTMQMVRRTSGGTQSTATNVANAGGTAFTLIPGSAKTPTVFNAPASSPYKAIPAVNTLTDGLKNQVTKLFRL